MYKPKSGSLPPWPFSMIALSRSPDFVIGGNDNPYLRRWWLIPRNRLFNVYLHHFIRSDDDRALHDHPWWNLSILLRGSYIEVTPRGRYTRHAPALVVRPRGEMAHRIELLPGTDRVERPVWTLFITGPKRREWGFLCPKGWRHWQDFTSDTYDDAGKKLESRVGRGCE